jgi:hypothetical protein
LFIRPAVTELNVAMSPDENDWQMSIGLCKFSSKIEPASLTPDNRTSRFMWRLSPGR